MPTPRSRDARTALPAHAHVAEQGGLSSSSSATVTLPSGKVITFRRLSGLDSCLLEQAMEEAGFTRLSGPGRATYIRCLALYAIEEIDGLLQSPPQDGAALKARLLSLADGDWDTLMTAYMTRAGMVPNDATFQPGGGATPR